MAYKKHTQFIFDDLENPYKKADYGDLGIMFKIFTLIAKTRDRKYMSQHELAEKTEIKQSYIAKLEAGRANPTLSQLLKITRALGLKITLEQGELPPDVDWLDG